MTALFGPAGNSQSFTAQGNRHTMEVPAYLKQFGLGAYEYQCGHGVRISEKKAAEFGEVAAEAGLVLSVHSPYYISLSSVEKEKRQNSVTYILETARVAKAMGATRVVVHSGSCAKITREEALGYAKQTLKLALDTMDEEGLGEVVLCPETMGKLNQLGTLQEVLSLCRVDERLLPCVDFGHLNARTFGAVATQEDYSKILNAIENALGKQRMQSFHSHFSKIEYTEKGGEKRHLTFEDTKFGPEFTPLAELIAKRDLAPTFICESAGTQAEDAAAMQQMYQNSKEQIK